MSWLRDEDNECLDPVVGELTDTEYRARRALLQYCAREHRETGVFHEREARHAAYGTPRGPRAVTRPQLARFIALGLVIPINLYKDFEIETLAIERPSGDGWLRPNKWERYNPPRDKTLAERQRRFQAKKRNDVTNGDVTENDGVSNGDETGPRAQPRGRVPVPYTKYNKNVLLDVEPADDLQNELKRLGPTPRQLERWRAAATSDPAHVRGLLAASLSADKPAALFDAMLKRSELPAASGPRRTGYRFVHGSHGGTYVRDVEGTDKPPYAVPETPAEPLAPVLAAEIDRLLSKEEEL